MENRIYRNYLKTPIGILEIITDSEELLEINFVKKIGVDSKDKIGNIVIEQLNEYFKRERKLFEFPFRISGTEFQKKVYRELLKIPYGEIRSYKDIAEAIDNPKGARAVGNANNRNRIPIVIPCHRVIGNDGRLVGYAGGLDIKKKLLEIEGIKL